MCASVNPNFTVRIWTDDDLDELPIFDRETYFGKWKNALAARKDYMQYNVLYEYGGIFLDVDFLCLEPLDELAWRYSYFSSLEPPVDFMELPLSSNAMIGASRHSPVMLKMIKDWEVYSGKVPDGNIKIN